MSKGPFRRGRQRQERLQPIEHLLEQARYTRKDAEFPFQPHDRDPHVPSNEECLRVGREKCHPLPRASLLLILRVYPRPVFAQLGHASESLRVMHEGLVEGFCQRRISDVCGSVVRSRGTTPHSHGVISNRRTIMRGPYPATRNHEIVPLNHSSARLDYFAFFIRYDLDSLQFDPFSKQ